MGATKNANQIMYLNDGPIQRERLPVDSKSAFLRRKSDGIFEQINALLNKMDRQQAGHETYPSVVCIDLQSRSADAVKLHPMIWENRGFDRLVTSIKAFYKL